MNHKSIIQHESERVYKMRNYVSHLLDQRQFEDMNQDAHVIQLNGYCLDAIDELPSGSMGVMGGKSIYGFPARPVINCVPRGVSLKEKETRDALARKIIEEILAEEATA